MMCEQRNAMIIEMRDSGRKYTDIAREMGITTERVRQIYMRNASIERRRKDPLFIALSDGAGKIGYSSNVVIRVYNTLRYMGCTTIEQLRLLSDNELLGYRYLGTKQLAIIHAAIGGDAS